MTARLTVSVEVSSWLEPFCRGLAKAAEQALEDGANFNHVYDSIRAALVVAAPYAVRVNGK